MDGQRPSYAEHSTADDSSLSNEANAQRVRKTPATRCPHGGNYRKYPIEGEHDFTAFAAADDTDELGRSKLRTIFSSEAWRDDDRLIYRVRGSGFLKHMVRNIVGVLLEAGKGNISDLEAHFDPSRQIPPGPTAPARGLFLINVEYQ